MHALLITLLSLQIAHANPADEFFRRKAKSESQQMASEHAHYRATARQAIKQFLAHKGLQLANGTLRCSELQFRSNMTDCSFKTTRNDACIAQDDTADVRSQQLYLRTTFRCYSAGGQYFTGLESVGW